LEIAQTGQTSDPYLVAVFRARSINTVMGGALVMPWEVDGLPQEWLDVFDALASGLPDMKEGQAKVDALKAKFLKGYK
jgi:hypothetical protein